MNGISTRQPLPPKGAEHLDLNEFGEAFGRFSERVGQRIFKFERLQEYIEGDNESWREFQKGDIKRSLDLMQDIRAAESQFDIGYFRRGLQFLRVRAIEIPLSRYIEWELQFHILSAQYGETILIADLTTGQPTQLLRDTRDFLLFDDFAVLIHDYNQDGVLCGGWISEDRLFIKRCVNLAVQLTSISVPLAIFMKDHPFSL